MLERINDGREGHYLSNICFLIKVLHCIKKRNADGPFKLNMSTFDCAEVCNRRE